MRVSDGASGRHEPPLRSPFGQPQPRRQSRQSGETADRAGGLRPESSSRVDFYNTALDIQQAKSLQMGAVQRHRYGHVPPAEWTKAGAGETTQSGLSIEPIPASRTGLPFRGQQHRYREQVVAAQGAEGFTDLLSLYQQQKIALGWSDKELFPRGGHCLSDHCDHAAIAEAGIQAEALPSESTRSAAEHTGSQSEEPLEGKSKG